MQILDHKPIISASDLNDRLACRHLLHLNLKRALGELDEEPVESETGKLLSGKGDAHEAAYLESLKARGLSVVELGIPSSSSIETLEEAAKATLEAMRSGPVVIFQGTFFDGESRGHTDFLFRVDRPSELGDFSYEVADTKLARNPKPYFIVQLCFYSELLEKVQGGGPPEKIHVILGDRRRESYRLADFAAYYRKLRRSFQHDLDAGVPDSRPYPVTHCGICRWQEHCARGWEETDHLSRVAGIRRDQVEALEEDGVGTLTALAGIEPDRKIDGVRPEALARLRSQAKLQLVSTQETPALELLEPRANRGFERLPKPSPGDIFFDFEGDPLYGNQGLEYLWGYVQVDSGKPVFEHIWAGDPGAERAAFEKFIDHVTARRREYPDLHIYHYAPYEVTALKRLAGTWATRGFELDELLRAKVFVDLYKVVREGLRLGQPSYSIKKVEAYYRPGQDGRETEVADGGASIVEFERWLETGDDKIKQAILDYNKDDCVSTLQCRDWLLGHRQAAEDLFGTEFPWFAETHETRESDLEADQENTELIATLERDVPAEAAERDADQQARWLLARLLGYHRREELPAWWAYFNRLDYSEPDQFVEDPETIGGLTPDETTPPRPVHRSLVHRLRFEPQETKIRAGGGPIDPATEGGAGTIVAISPAEGWVDLKRGPSLKEAGLPRDLVPGKPYDQDLQREALRTVAAHIAEHGMDGDGPYRAGRDLLSRRPPRLSGATPGEELVSDPSDIDELITAVHRMDRSYLFIQGPPGAGKTWSGSRLITALLAEGKRIGVTSTSHKAINNLLHAVEEAAVECGVEFGGLKKSGAGNEFESRLDQPLVGSESKNGPLNDPAVQLVAGTSFYFCREDTLPVDFLFIDEAGQISLADALALGIHAENMVLLGDPQQLPQVSLGRHPEGAEVSVLEHLLGPHQTVPPEQGIFLDQTWRMHPEVTGFISELAYEGRLGSADGMERQRVNAAGDLGGTGLRWVPVEHHGRSQRSQEEADRVAAMVADLLAGDPAFVDAKRVEHPLGLEDILVVSPYNAQVACLTDTLPPGARVGTVDKFQGQEAQVVIFSMATSSGEDIPRNIDFLFSRNRLNVAISRARSLAILVASPDLLHIQANTIEQMRLINGICRFVEMAEPDVSTV